MSASVRPTAAGWRRAPLRVRLRGPGSSARTRSHGQALVELAIILPVFLVIVGAAIDLGRLFSAYVSIENAAKEGAFYGATNPLCDVPKTGCASPNTVDWHVRNELPGVAIGSPTVECLAAGSGAAKALAVCVEDDLYRVGVTHQFSLLTPLLSPILGGSFPVSSTATAVVFNEAFDPSATPFPIPTSSATPTPTPTAPPAGCSSAPAANFSFTVQNKRADFTDTSTTAVGCTITAWSWAFGDGATSSAQNPTHQYPSKDTPYSATLTVTNSFGSNSLTQTVTTQ